MFRVAVVDTVVVGATRDDREVETAKERKGADVEEHRL